MRLNQEGYKAKAFILISDNESWIDGNHYYNLGNGTKTHEEWLKFKKRNPGAKMICIDISPNATSQIQERPDILQIAGFSDQVFGLMAEFIRGGNSANFWINEIDKIEV